jgi:CDP-glucose 4,6-dehydratase
MAVSAFWRDRPVFVTGATGLVGSWLVQGLLARGASVTCLIRDWAPDSELIRQHRIERIKIVRGDVCDSAVLERALGEYEIDTVFHLAAQTIVGVANRNPMSTFESNIQGTWTLLEACRRSPAVKQIVVASSDKAYGGCRALPYSESTALEGRHPYDVSKSCADLIAQSYHATYNLPVTVTRCGNFYGGGDLNWNRIVPGTIRSIQRGQPPVIRSGGNYIRDYFYVEDGAAAYMLLAERLAADRELSGEAFNFSNEIQITVLQIVDRILALMGSGLKPEIRNEASHEIRDQHLSAAKARNMLGWAPLFELDEALARTVDWYGEFFQEGNPSRLNPQGSSRARSRVLQGGIPRAGVRAG